MKYSLEEYQEVFKKTWDKLNIWEKIMFVSLIVSGLTLLIFGPALCGM